MSRIIYVNGRYLPEQEAVVSVFDRGFLFGDGIYEVVPVIKGQLVDKQYFLERLHRSLDEVGIAWPCASADYLGMMQRLVVENQLDEGVVYSQVTRGVAERDFAFPADTPPSLMAFTQVMELLDSPAARTGIAVVTGPDLRWKRRDIKSINLLGQCLAKQEAVSKGATECWMVEDGLVTEGASSSAYIVRDGRLITRPLSTAILPGIRRRTLLEIAEYDGIECEQRSFRVREALAADEAFISSAGNMVTGVVRIDGQSIGDGKPGAVTTRLRELYLQRIVREAEQAREEQA